MHDTVLLEEAVEALVVDPDGFYIDGTFGRGGHSRAILNRLSAQGRLLAIDKDPQAVQVAERSLGRDPRFVIARGSYTQATELAASMEWLGKVSGVLLDLGVSSPQLDQADRGFSFRMDGELDMRMDPDEGDSAAQWLATAELDDIARIIKQYGEERFAYRIAKAIVEQRTEQALETTTQLADLVAEAVPTREKGKHPATRTFQAIRIHVNKELDDLQSILAQVLAILGVQGRLVVISFHSLEDRLVKRFIRQCERGDPLPSYIPVRHEQLNQRMRRIGKAVKPGAEEIAHNSRARSAIMRIGEKIA